MLTNREKPDTMYITIEKQITKDYKMKLGKNSRKIIKEYIENEVKIARYGAVKPKQVVIKGKPRKPSFGWKAPK